MKTTLAFEIEIEHDGSSSSQEFIDFFIMEMESHNTGLKTDPDDFGAVNYLVVKAEEVVTQE